MIILQDTREQTPLDFSHCLSFVGGVKEIKLNVGDYGAEFNDGVKSSYYFERKTINDLYGTLGKEYNRFKKEIERAKATQSTLILIVEGSISAVEDGWVFCDRKGISILKTMFTLLMRYGVYPVFCYDSLEMAKFIGHFYWAEERNIFAKKALDKKQNRRSIKDTKGESK